MAEFIGLSPCASYHHGVGRGLPSEIVNLSRWLCALCVD